MSIIEKALERLDRSAPQTDKGESKSGSIAGLSSPSGSGVSDPDVSDAQALPKAQLPSADVYPVPDAVVTAGLSAEPEIPHLDLSGIPGMVEADVPELDLEQLVAEGLPGTTSADDLPAQEPKRTSAEVTVDVAKLEVLGLLSPNIGNSPLAEQMRVIKRPLLLQATATDEDRASNSNLILVASALPDEGKTSTAINLAISIAMERDRTVLLVDADVAKSDVSNILGVEAEFGLTDLLHDPELSIPDVMLRTNIPKLSLLPAGNRHPNLTELFAGDDMRRLMLDLSSRYSDRIIVIDSPPLLATSGASVLGSLVGQIVMVVEAVRTPQSAVAEALRMLGPLDNIGIVLNKARERPSFSYGYGYGYEHYVKQPTS